MRKMMILACLAATLFFASGAMADSFTIQAEPVCYTDMGEGAFFYEGKITVATDYDIAETIKVQGGTAAWVTVSDWDDFVQAVNGNGKLLPAKNGKASKNNTVILRDNIAGLTAAEGSKEYTVIVCGVPCENCPNVLGGFTASYEYFDEVLQQVVEVKAVAYTIDFVDYFETLPVLSCDFVEECVVVE